MIVAAQNLGRHTAAQISAKTFSHHMATQMLPKKIATKQKLWAEGPQTFCETVMVATFFGPKKKFPSDVRDHFLLGFSMKIYGFP